MGLLARWVYRSLARRELRRAREVVQPECVEQGEAGIPNLGVRGETLAYWYLRQAGYTIVARNWRARSGAGELDLVGWDGPVLAFVEVKTRTSEAAGPPELAVSQNKQARIIKAAAGYLRQLKAKPVNYRFDIVSIYLSPARDLKVRLIKNAFRGRVSIRNEE